MTGTRSAAALEHDIGPNGSLSIRLGTSDVRLRAGSGTTVSVHVDPAELDRAFDVIQTAGSLSLRAGRGLLLSSLRGQADLDEPLVVEVPAGATIVVETGSGAIHIEGLHGQQRYRTVSGDITLAAVAGAIAIEAVSGDVDVVAVGPLGLSARTTSGDLAIRAVDLDGLRLSTTSGDVRVTGRPLGDGPFTVDTVSGDTVLALAGDATVEVGTVTGDVLVDVDARSEGPRGHRTLTLGRGGPRFTVRSMSGDVHLVRPVAISEPAAVTLDPSDEAESPERARPAGPVPATDVPSADGEAARLEILHALERGDIDIAAAEASLDALDRAALDGDEPAPSDGAAR